MSLFNNEKDRDLWIQLNAQHQIESDKLCRTPDGRPTLQALHPRSMEEAIKVAKRQLEYDEEHGKLRFTLEQYLTLSTQELKKLAHDDFKEKVLKYF